MLGFVFLCTGSLTALLPLLPEWCITHGIPATGLAASTLLQGVANVTLSLFAPRMDGTTALRICVVCGAAAGLLLCVAEEVVGLCAARTLLGVCGGGRVVCYLQNDGDDVRRRLAALMGMQLLAAQLTSGVTGMLPLVTSHPVRVVAVAIAASNAVALLCVPAGLRSPQAAAESPPVLHAALFVAVAAAASCGIYALDTYATWLAHDLFNMDAEDVWWYWAMQAATSSAVALLYVRGVWNLWRPRSFVVGTVVSASCAYAAPPVARMAMWQILELLAVVTMQSSTLVWAAEQPDRAQILAVQSAVSQVGRIVGPLVVGTCVQAGAPTLALSLVLGSFVATVVMGVALLHIPPSSRSEMH